MTACLEQIALQTIVNGIFNNNIPLSVVNNLPYTLQNDVMHHLNVLDKKHRKEQMTTLKAELAIKTAVQTDVDCDMALVNYYDYVDRAMVRDIYIVPKYLDDDEEPIVLREFEHPEWSYYMRFLEDPIENEMEEYDPETW